MSNSIKTGYVYRDMDDTVTDVFVNKNDACDFARRELSDLLEDSAELSEELAELESWRNGADSHYEAICSPYFTIKEIMIHF